MRSGAASERHPWVPRTAGSACSSLPPGAATAAEGSEYPTPSAQRYGSNRGGAAGRTGPVRPSLDTWAKDYWPTTSRDAVESRRETARTENWKSNPGTTLSDKIQDFPEVAEMDQWPTPRTVTGGAESAERKKELGREKSGGGDLQAAAQGWPTPRTTDVQSGRGCESHGRTFYRPSKELEAGRKVGQANLADVSEHLIGQDPEGGWPTPAARDYRAPNSSESQERRAKGREKAGQQLPNFVAHGAEASPETDWSDFPLFRRGPATATSGKPSSGTSPNSPPPSPGRTWKAPHGFPAGNGPDGNEFSTQVRKEAVEMEGSAEKGPIPRGKAKRLNPLFVGWLMGWPPLWHVARTRCGPRAMAWWAYRQRQLLWSLLVGSA